MIGREFQSATRWPWLAIFFLIAALFLFAIAVVTRESGWLAGAILPGLLAAFLWRASRSPLRIRLGQNELEVLSKQLVLPYNQIVALRRVARKGRSDLLAVATDRWLLELPDSASFPITEIETFLRARIPHFAARQPPAEMQEYYQHQVELFGNEKVAVIPARQQYSSFSIAPPRFRRNAIALACVLTGVAWIVYGASMGEQKVAFAGFGAMMLVLILLVWAIVRVRPWASPRKVLPKLRNACLIISPQGLAMMQADMNGTLPWEEVLDVKETAIDRSFRIGSLPNSLLIKLHGAELLLPDIYQESPTEIAARLRSNLGTS